MDGWVLDSLAELVTVESPSGDSDATRQAVEAFADVVRRHLDPQSPDRIEVSGRTHLCWTWGEPVLLVVGHVDTVWPAGTIDRWPFAVDGDRASGPGVFDMKCGLIQAVLALSRLSRLDGIRLLVTTDEELGSPTSAELVKDSARGLRAALVCEPSVDGAVKTARKGIALYEVTATGRAAHAGLEPEKGANAGLGLAHALVAVTDLGDPQRGTTVTPTRLEAGTTSNTVPAEGRFAIDVRAVEEAELDRVDRSLREVLADCSKRVPGVSLELTGGVNRPPLHPDASASLFTRLRRIDPAITGKAVGGGSDGNFTAGIGVPTLDGLGAVGDGAHAEGEHVVVSAIEPRAALLAALVDDVRGGDGR
ncbi:MAG TPA: M20 family metallopeptidase [Mycobacteriales bacterium]|nr:M20 family metallopeptidase [Mycobacteriales bacterium]